MKFSYETQGAITYLVCELEPAEQVDGIALGMLTNNHIAGFAPLLYTEMNGQRFLKYNISAKVSSDQFFSGNMNRQRTLQAFHNILSAICSADEYMIDQNCFSVAAEHIFLNVSNCETALICVPVIIEKDINKELAELFKKIMFSTQFDSSEDASYITQLITYINSGAAFNVYGLRDLVDSLQSGSPVLNPAAVQQTPQVSQTYKPVASVSSFDSTISIDDMSAAMQNHTPPQINTPPVQQAPLVSAPPVQRPVVQTPPPSQPKPPVIPTGRPINSTPAPAGGNVSQGGFRQQTPAPVAATPVRSNPGFAIPGQAPATAKAVPSAPSAVPAANQQSADKGDKKMSFFGLLANYNKANAELYKKQKEEAKKAKAAKMSEKAAAKPVKPVANKVATAPSAPQSYQQGVPMGTAQQPFAQVQHQPVMPPMPVQNSFNETTVLGPMTGGETTVLGADPGVPQPCLTRVKSGERISINKPVFRIGKEKSYVDYFIADNTAISRSHANIHTENGEYFIEDTNSTNHTYINGKLINCNVKIKLSSGDKVRLANEDFIFTL